MANAWRGNGAGFSELFAMRVGAGGVGERTRLAYWNGSAYVYRWEEPMVYGFITQSTLAGSGASYGGIAGANPVADSAYPYTVFSSGIVIPPQCPVYSANLHAEFSHTGGTVPRYGQVRIHVNGNVVVEGNSQSASPGTSIADTNMDVAPGDVITCQWRGEGNFFNRPTLSAGAWCRVTPNQRA
ncbi:hypothetical protein SEA_LIGMA_37 [Gordonia phage Ligma]|nr:hypothetical protein SEA_LIGMA_37 [Gordonia phage Ligma]UQT02138.1 hypothetical protein SEA_AXUMITE_37 [Gordonia phage Axumite]